jgi:hypothetical protein
MCGGKRLNAGSALRLILLLTACCASATAQVITSLQASVTGGSPANVNSITIGTQVNGFTLYINGTFVAGDVFVVNWDDNTNGIHTQLPIQGPPTTAQIVALVGPALYFAVKPATVQITVLQLGVPSNSVNFFIVPPPTSVASFPNAFVGIAYGPVAAIQNGTPPYTLATPTGSLPPGVAFNNATGQLGTATVVLSPPGPYNFQSPAIDFWGANVAPSPNITIQSIGTPTVSTVNSSAGLSYGYGTLTTLTASIGPAGATPPFAPNTVQFLDGATVLGTVSVVPASGLATLSNVFLNVGSHSVQAKFTGDTNWAAVTGAASVIRVNPGPANISFSGAPFAAPYGGLLSAGSLTVAGPGGPAAVPSGSVTITVAGATITTFNNINPGAVVTPNSLTGLQLPASVAAGAQSVTYNYSGDANYAAQTGSAALTVTRALPSETIVVTTNPIAYGSSETLTAMVKPPGLGTPTGTVTFLDGTTALPGGTVALPGSGIATFTISTLSAGVHALSASYSGDANFFASQSPPSGLTVNQAQPTVSLALSANPVTTGQPETLTATVTPPGLGTPTGTVTFLDGATALPGGTVALPASGIATFTISALSAGVHVLSASYSGDANFLAVQSSPARLAVNNAPLAFVTTSLPGGTALQPYSAPVTVIGGTGSYTITATGLPSGLNVNPQTGTVSGSPTSVGTFPVTFTAVDSAGAKVSQTLTLVVAPPLLRISASSTLPSGTVGVGYSATIGVVGGTSPFTFTASGGLPPGLTFVPGGALVTGTPTTVGTFSFTVRVVDANGATDSGDFSITIKPAPLSIPGGPANPTGTTGTPININLGCTGGVTPYTYSVTGSLPPGVTFANCILSGTPTSSGTFVIHILMTDAAGASVSRDISITIAPTGLTLGGGSLPDGQVGVSYKSSVSATGGVAPITYSAAGLPDGLSMAGTGDITGTPTTVGQYSVRVTATDSSRTTAPVTASATYSLNIAGPSLAFGTPALPDGTVGVAYSGSLNAAGGTKPYRFTATGVPDGLTLGTDGSVSGTPTTAGTFTVNATVTDAAKASVNQSYTIKIAPPPLVIPTATAPNGTVGTQYSTTFSATGGAPPYVFSATGQPSTLTMSAAGTLSGTPAAPGSFTLVVTVKDANGVTTSKSYAITMSLPSSPPLNFAGINTTVNALQQPRVSVALANPFPVDVQVTLNLTFQADSGPPDPAVVFSTGGATVTITIPAGSLNGATDVGIQTGTVAGTITITAKLAAAGADVTPSPAPTRTARIGAGAPVIVSATGTRTSSGFTITVVGYVTDREMTTAVYGFNGSNLGTATLTVTVDTLFGGWLGGNSPPSAQYGSQFTYTQPFNVNGTNTAITSVTVTLNNKVGASNTVTVTLQ